MTYKLDKTIEKLYAVCLLHNLRYYPAYELYQIIINDNGSGYVELWSEDDTRNLPFNDIKGGLTKVQTLAAVPDVNIISHAVHDPGDLFVNQCMNVVNAYNYFVAHYPKTSKSRLIIYADSTATIETKDDSGVFRVSHMRDKQGVIILLEKQEQKTTPVALTFSSFRDSMNIETSVVSTGNEFTVVAAVKATDNVQAQATVINNEFNTAIMKAVELAVHNALSDVVYDIASLVKFTGIDETKLGTETKSYYDFGAKETLWSCHVEYKSIKARSIEKDQSLALSRALAALAYQFVIKTYQ